MDKNNYCVIMAGGAGTRLWPVSRTGYPKQFLEVGNTGRSFLRVTYDRYARLFPAENILIVTVSRYRDLVKQQIPEIPDANILSEPYSRNTAPCITYATYTLLKRNPDASMVVTPADHLIFDEDTFGKTVTNALEYACREKVLMTIGLMPTRPDTNYGYIQVTGGKSACHADTAVKVKTFTEKPDADLARVFVESGEFLWNSGIFAWTAQTIREEMEKYIRAAKLICTADYSTVLKSPDIRKREKVCDIVSGDLLLSCGGRDSAYSARSGASPARLMAAGFRRSMRSRPRWAARWARGISREWRWRWPPEGRACCSGCGSRRCSAWR